MTTRYIVLNRTSRCVSRPYPSDEQSSDDSRIRQRLPWKAHPVRNAFNLNSCSVRIMILIVVPAVTAQAANVDFVRCAREHQYTAPNRWELELN